MLRCAVCDDEKIYLERIEANIHKYANENKISCLVDVFTSGEDLIKNGNMDYDVYFLDIMMKKLDGMELAGIIREKNPIAIVVFISGYIQYAARGYRVSAIRYILKSQLDEEFTDSMNAIIAKLELNEDMIEVGTGSKQRLIKVASIRYIENFKRKIYVHLVGDQKEVIEAYGKITKLAEELHEFGFIYCHAAYLVNAKEIAEICPAKFVLFSGEEVPISRQRYAQSQKEYYFQKTKSNLFGKQKKEQVCRICF